MPPKHGIETTKAASDVDRGPDSIGVLSVVKVFQFVPAQTHALPYATPNMLPLNGSTVETTFKKSFWEK